jgi:hypothetical protein
MLSLYLLKPKHFFQVEISKIYAVIELLKDVPMFRPFCASFRYFLQPFQSVTMAQPLDSMHLSPAEGRQTSSRASLGMHSPANKSFMAVTVSSDASPEAIVTSI